MYRLSFVLSLFLSNAIAFIIGQSGCTISVNEDLGDPQPLLLKVGRKDASDAFHLPIDNEGTILFKNGQELEVVCPSGGYLKSLDTAVSSARASCVPGNLFKIHDQKYSFVDIVCSANKHTARYTGKTCLKKYKEIEIGFELENEFLPHILICFDPLQQNTLYSVFNLTSAIGGGQVNYPRPSFLQGNFYDVGKTNVNNLYTRKVQKTTINALVGLPEDSTKYVKDTGNNYLARGHFTAKSDFVFGSQHRLTFYYVNVAPQWQGFNNGNWKILEGEVRKYASKTGKNLIVYTGSYGVTTLPHEETGKDVEIFLYAEGENRAIPVPDLFWKVVYDPKTYAGTAFLGVNNPYHKDLSKSIICDDISNKIEWLQWNKTNTDLGYSYACTVDNFRKTVTTLPDFKVVSLLI